MDLMKQMSSAPLPWPHLLRNYEFVIAEVASVKLVPGIFKHLYMHT